MNFAQIFPLLLVPILGLMTHFWLIGFAFKAVADWQLMRFKANPANKVKLFRDGLWHFSRHPNNFDEPVQWWGFYLPAAVVGAWWSIISPVLMTFQLLRVSGVSLLEKTMRSRTGH